MKKFSFILAVVIIMLAVLPNASHSAVFLGANPNDANGFNVNGANVSTSSGGGCTKPNDFASLFDYALCILVRYVTPFLMSLGVVIFIVGVLNYVRSGDDAEKKAAGRDLMWFGIIALFVMVSVWGFVSILTRSFFGKEATFESLPKRATSIFAQ